MEKGEDKACYSAYRYYQRACTRPTPFGLFAGCSVGKIGGEYTNILLFGQDKYRRNTRLDMNYICALTQQIESPTAIAYLTDQALYVRSEVAERIEI
jgi:hypothetical protein